MYAGRIVEGGDSETVTQTPAHPYTQLLIASAPDPDRLAGTRTAPREDRGSGEPPSLIAPPAGCRFHPRCPMAMPRCTHRACRVRSRSATARRATRAACWLFDELTATADDAPARAAEVASMRYFLRRIAFYLVTAWAAITINFFIPRMMPGDPVQALIAQYQGQIEHPARSSRCTSCSGSTRTQSLWQQYVDYWGSCSTATSACPSRSSRRR